MKKLFFNTITVSLLLINSCAIAQNNLSASHAPKFIDGIEITPGSSSAAQTVVVRKTIPTKKIEAEKIETKAAEDCIEHCVPLQFKYALLTDRDVESIANLPLYDFINHWVDTRYRYGGTGQGGIDCSSFADTLMKKVYNVVLPRTSRDQYQVCTMISAENLMEGDLVFFDINGSGVSHVGIYLGNGYFVHSSTHGVTIDNLNEDYYNRTFIGGGRVQR